MCYQELSNVSYKSDFLGIIPLKANKPRKRAVSTQATKDASSLSHRATPPPQLFLPSKVCLLHPATISGWGILKHQERNNVISKFNVFSGSPLIKMK
jgi:hypothetical protein